ncbi:MAG: T9SS type A sorting domain-containing protein [Bacteroidetes bacterium]|nr:T9SS type A sorting domain-containing protein [Bacteroidota bacterium]
MGCGKNGYVVRKGNSGALSVNDVISPVNITLFPNPASDFFTVQFSEPSENGAFNIEVYSMDGRLVKMAERGIRTIQISDLNSGIYMVKVIKDSMVFSTKLLKP